MIKINEASDQKNQKEFKKLHRFSVLIFCHSNFTNDYNIYNSLVLISFE